MSANSLLLLLLMALPEMGCLLAQTIYSETTLPVPIQRMVTGMVSGKDGHLWIATQKGLYRYDGHRYVAYNTQADNANRISQEGVNRMAVAQDGNLLLFCVSSVIDILDTRTNELTSIDIGKLTNPHGQMRVMCQEEDGRIFLVTEHDEGYAVFEYSDKGFHKKWEVKEHRPTNPLHTGGSRFYIFEQKDGNYLVHDRENGLLLFDAKGVLLRRYTPKEEIRDNEVLNFMIPDKKQGYYISYRNRQGVYHFDPKTGVLTLDEKFPSKFHYLSTSKDTRGNWGFVVGNNDIQVAAFLIWDKYDDIIVINDMGHTNPHSHAVYSTDFFDYLLYVTEKGLMKIDTRSKSVHKILEGQNISSRGIIEDGNGNLILGTEEHGWFLLDKATGSLSAIAYENPVIPWLSPPKFMRNFVRDAQGNIWATAYGGAVVPVMPDGFLLRYRPSEKGIEAFHSKYRIEAILVSKAGVFYCASIGMLQVFDPLTGTFSSLVDNYTSPAAGSLSPNCIMEDREGMIWIGTDKALVKFNPETKTTTLYAQEGGLIPAFTSFNIMCILEGTDGQLWLGTQGGLHRFDPATLHVEVITRKNGLPDDNICGLLYDDNGQLWASTFNGLCHINPDTKVIRSFFTTDGFNDNEFNRHSFYRTADGTYYFGGMNGFNAFRSEELLEPGTAHKVLFSELSYYGAKGDSLLQLPMASTTFPWR
ncbi:MAG: two-component regulator propeller domain-containing protein [Saprospiraceae bacterium]